ncbi:hypothetical protein [Marinobacter sp. OP 3.4]|uniref:hypothetical protein n=1 Tax=Marinobacter sp. OP 3.4 TaxID=3076501 RepID=UPI002E1ACFAC
MSGCASDQASHQEGLPNGFNSTNDDNAFDDRSDDKGPEPEAVTTGMIDGQPHRTSDAGGRQ